MKMRLCLLLLLLFFSSLTTAQEWFKTYNTWYYGLGDPFFAGYQKVELVEETQIQGRQCFVGSEFYVVSHEIFGGIDSSSLPGHIFHERNDSVFLYTNNEFHLVYDFNLSTGDTFTIDPISFYEGITEWVIDSISNIEFETDTLRVQWIRLITEIGDGYSEEGVTFEVIEKIGTRNRLFFGPLFYPHLVDAFDNPIRCYKNGEVVITNPYVPCDFVVATDIRDVQRNSLSIYPNPFQDYLMINEDLKLSTAILTDIMGRTIGIGQITENKIQFENTFPPGLYLLKLETKDGMVYVEKVISG